LTPSAISTLCFGRFSLFYTCKTSSTPVFPCVLHAKPLEINKQKIQSKKLEHVP